MIRLPLTVLAVAVAAAVAGSVSAQAAPKAAIFPFELIDDSLIGQYNGPQADDAKRLELATEELRKLAAQDYDVVDLRGIAPEIEKQAPIYKCNGCERDLARKAGADVAVTLAVRKFSSLLLSLHIYVTDVKTGNLTKMHRIDIRGNTDESWLRGVRWLVERGLHVGG